MSEEVAHDGIVRLINWGAAHPRLLAHMATGEFLELDGRFRLSFVGGRGLLTPSEGAAGEARWVNDLFDCSAHRLIDGGIEDAGSEIFFFSKNDDASLMYRDLRPEVKAQVFLCRTSFGDFKAEVYEHRAPVEHAGARRFWTCPFPQAYVYGSDCHNRWACPNFASWCRLLRSSRFPTLGFWGGSLG